MSEMLKVASLKPEEQEAFVRHSTPRHYVLAKKLKDRPWDTGSVWKLTDVNGEACIARVTEDKFNKEDTPTGLGGASANHAVHAMMKTAAQMDFPAEQTPAPEGFEKEAAVEGSEVIGTGLPEGMTVTSDYFWGKILPTVNAWCQAGFSDVTPEGIRTHAALQVKMGKLSAEDAELISLEADRVIAYAQRYAVAEDQTDLFEDGAPKSSPTKPSVGYTNADKVLSSLAALKPAHMSWPAFLKAYKGMNS